MENEKIILGLNGWYDKSHDASVAILKIKNGIVTICGALEEERVSRMKYAYDTLPVHSLHSLLNYLSISPADIDVLVVGWDFSQIFGDYSSNVESKYISDLFANFNESSNATLAYINHHKSHAASTARTSGYKNAYILVLDGQGELESTTLWEYSKGELTQKSSSSIAASLGYLFDAAGDYIGFGIGNAGKTMGLAPYGDPVYYDTLSRFIYVENKEIKVTSTFDKLINSIGSNSYDLSLAVLRSWRLVFNKYLGLALNDSPIVDFRNIEKKYADLAASIQKVLENIVYELLDQNILNGIKVNLCLSGGVALNCKLNGLLFSHPKVNEIYVQPAAGDSGVALGAALEYAYTEFNAQLDEKVFSPYLGISYSDDEIIKQISTDFRKEIGEKKQIQNKLAKLISQNKVVGIFSGREEWGPRALGNRSIVCRADFAENVDRINNFVKHRELGRPLGPSIIEKTAVEKFGWNLEKCFYMTTAHKLDFTNYIKTAHIDGTIRPQIVTPDFNLDYFELLSVLKDQYDIHAVINTSFNDSTPIVHTPPHALKLLGDGQLDVICFNHRILVWKNCNE